MRKLRIDALAVLAAGATVLLLTSPAGAGDNSSGFSTSQAAMLTPLAPGSSCDADHERRRDARRSGYMLESIPDGISLRRARAGAASTST